MIVRELFALFGFKVDEKSAGDLDKRLTGAIDKIKQFAAVAAVAFTIKKIKDVAEQTAELGDQISTTAERLGLTTDAFQELQFAAEKADVSQEEFAAGLRTLTRNAGEAAGGNKTAAEAFADVGVNVRDASGNVKSADVLLEEAAQGISKLGSAAEQAAASQKLMGRSGAAFGPLLKKGAGGLRELRKEAQKYGGILDKELIKLSEQWDDQTKLLNRGMQGLTNTLAKAALPTINKINKAFTEFIAEHKELIDTGIELFVGTLAAAIDGLVSTVLVVVDAIADWVEGLDPISKTLVGISAAAAALAAFLLLPAAPIILLIGLVGLILQDFMAWRDGGESVIGDLVAILGQLGDAFPNVRDALFAVWESFTQIFSALTDTVFSFVQFFIDLFTVGPAQAIANLGTNLTAAWDAIWSNLLAGMPVVIEGLIGMFDAFTAWIADLLGPEITGIFSAIWDTVSNVVVTLVEGIENYFLSIVTFVSDVFTKGLVTAFSNLWDNLKATAGQFVDGVLQHFRNLANLGGKVLSFLGIGGETPAAGGAATPAAGAAGLAATFGAGGAAMTAPTVTGRAPTSVTSSPTNNVSVSVNASGAQNPEEVASAVAQQVEIIMDRQHREALNALTVAAPA